MTFQLGLCPEHFITLIYYTDITNGSVIKEHLPELGCAIINAALIVDTFQVMAAANKAQWCKDTNTMRTRNINTELLYRLSPSTNVRVHLFQIHQVTETLTFYGAQVNTLSMLFVKFDANPDDVILSSPSFIPSLLIKCVHW